MAHYRHEDVAQTPAGWRVRTVTSGEHRIRVAIGPGGASRTVQILHPAGERNPCNVRYLLPNPSELLIMGANPTYGIERPAVSGGWALTGVYPSKREAKDSMRGLPGPKRVVRIMRSGERRPNPSVIGQRIAEMRDAGASGKQIGRMLSQATANPNLPQRHRGNPFTDRRGYWVSMDASIVPPWACVYVGQSESEARDVIDRLRFADQPVQAIIGQRQRDQKWCVLTRKRDGSRARRMLSKATANPHRRGREGHRGTESFRRVPAFEKGSLGDRFVSMSDADFLRYLREADKRVKKNAAPHFLADPRTCPKKCSYCQARIEEAERLYQAGLRRGQAARNPNWVRTPHGTVGRVMELGGGVKRRPHRLYIPGMGERSVHGRVYPVDPIVAGVSPEDVARIEAIRGATGSSRFGTRPGGIRNPGGRTGAMRNADLGGGDSEHGYQCFTCGSLYARKKSVKPCPTCGEPVCRKCQRKAHPPKHNGENPRGISRSEAQRLGVPEQHQLRIARETLKLSDVGARIMGGMTKEEAREVIRRLTGRAALKEWLRGCATTASTPRPPHRWGFPVGVLRPTARIAGAASRADRLRWAAAEWAKTHPGERLKAYKLLDHATRGYGHNPSDAAVQGAAAMFETFHGRPAKEVLELQEPEQRGVVLSGLGELVALTIDPAGANGNGKHKWIELDFAGEGIRLASNAKGSQLYLVGGNQALTAQDLARFGTDTSKELVELGELVGPESIVYRSAKSFTDHKPANWKHEFAEEGGQPPIAVYDKAKRRIMLVGGSYRVEAPGIIN